MNDKALSIIIIFIAGILIAFGLIRAIVQTVQKKQEEKERLRKKLEEIERRKREEYYRKMKEAESFYPKGPTPLTYEEHEAFLKSNKFKFKK